MSGGEIYALVLIAFIALGAPVGLVAVLSARKGGSHHVPAALTPVPPTPPAKARVMSWEEYRRTYPHNISIGPRRMR